ATVSGTLHARTANMLAVTTTARPAITAIAPNVAAWPTPWRRGCLARLLGQLGSKCRLLFVQIVLFQKFGSKILWRSGDVGPPFRREVHQIPIRPTLLQSAIQWLAIAGKWRSSSLMRQTP